MAHPDHDSRPARTRRAKCGPADPEKIEALFREQIEKRAGLGEKPQGLGPVPHGAEKAALARLITISRGDTDQSRRVADFLLAWWKSGACGPFDLTNLWGVDDAIAADMVKVFAYIASTNKYPDTLGYKDEFEAIAGAWRPELT